MTKLPPMIERELLECGRPWTLRQRRRHIQIFIEDRCVAVVTSANLERRSINTATLNVRAAIRRYLRDQS